VEHREYVTIEEYQSFVGKTISSITKDEVSDVGLSIAFTDGSILEFGFSGQEGTISFELKTSENPKCR
jgi:hypothetical protein